MNNNIPPLDKTTEFMLKNKQIFSDIDSNIQMMDLFSKVIATSAALAVSHINKKIDVCLSANPNDIIDKQDLSKLVEVYNNTTKEINKLKHLVGAFENLMTYVNDGIDENNPSVIKAKNVHNEIKNYVEKYGIAYITEVKENENECCGQCQCSSNSPNQKAKDPLENLLKVIAEEFNKYNN